MFVLCNSPIWNPAQSLRAILMHFGMARPARGTFHLIHTGQVEAYLILRSSLNTIIRERINIADKLSRLYHYGLTSFRTKK